MWNSGSKQAVHPPPPILSRLPVPHALLFLGAGNSQVVLLSPPGAAPWALLSLLAGSPSAVLDILHLRWVSLPCRLFPYRLLLVRRHQTGSCFLAADACLGLGAQAFPSVQLSAWLWLSPLCSRTFSPHFSVGSCATRDRGGNTSLCPPHPLQTNFVD